MNYFFAHEAGLCVYVGQNESARAGSEEKLADCLKNWLAWYRRRGISCFYVYYAEEMGVLGRLMEGESLSGLALLLKVNVPPQAEVGPSIYRDCLQRSRYVCRSLFYLDLGEYIEGVEGSLSAWASAQFESSTAALVLPREAPGGPCYIANPLAARALRTDGNLVYAKDWVLKGGEGAVVTRRKPPKRIAVLSHVMARNGAPLALLGVVRLLKGKGYEVDVYSVCYGLMEPDFEALGVNLVIDPLLNAVPLVDQPWYHSYDVIFANTAVMLGCFDKPLGSVPAVWWLHEPKGVLAWCGVTKERLADIHPDGVRTLCVSGIAARDFKALAPNWPIDGILTMGLKDVFSGQRRKKAMGESFVFLMVGTLQKNKGQDIFLQAASLLAEEQRKKCEFWVLGVKGQSTEPGYLDKIKAMAAENPEVKLLGRIPHEQIWEIYERADAVVVPSLEETLSMVAMEAMMMSVPCIMSDSVGMAGFIEEGESALAYPVGEAARLSEKMQYLLSHPQEAERIGQAGRKLYEQNFTDAKFAENLIKCVAAAM